MCPRGRKASRHTRTGDRTVLRVFLNGLPTNLGGGATVWRALVDGARHCDVEFFLLTGSAAVAELVEAGRGRVETKVVQRRLGSLQGELFLLDRVAKRWKADVLITHNRTALRARFPQIALHVNLTRFLPRSSQRPRIELRETVRDALAGRSLRKAQANVFESHFLLQCARDRFGTTPISRPSVAYVGLDRRWCVASTDSVLSAKARGPALLAVTSPNPHKDNELLADVVAHLVAMTGVEWRLRVAGGRSAADFPLLVARAGELGVEERLDFLGFVERETLQATVDRTFALLSPSRVESFAMVPLEAMARGTPVIVTDSTSMPESVGRAGRIVPARDPHRMAREVEAMWTSPGRWRDASVASREWASRLTWSAFSEAVVEVAHSISPSKEAR